MMYKNYHFYKVFFPYARNNIKVFWVGDSRGKKGVTPFLIAEFEKSFIDHQESREWDFHYFRTGNISQISSVCGPYIVCLVWFDSFCWTIDPSFIKYYHALLPSIPFVAVFSPHFLPPEMADVYKLGDTELFPNQLFLLSPRQNLRT